MPSLRTARPSFWARCITVRRSKTSSSFIIFNKCRLAFPEAGSRNREVAPLNRNISRSLLTNTLAGAYRVSNNLSVSFSRSGSLLLVTRARSRLPAAQVVVYNVRIEKSGSRGVLTWRFVYNLACLSDCSKRSVALPIVSDFPSKRYPLGFNA